MERITGSWIANSEKKRRVAVSLRRFVMASLLVSATVLAGLPGSRSQAAQAPSYRTVTFSAGASPTAARIADLDGDDRKDIAVVNQQGDLQIFFNGGGGSFQRVSLNGLWPSGSRTLGVDIGDLNSDGLNDIAVAFSTQAGAISVLFNRGSRTFAAPVNFNVCNASNGVAIGDLDGDGDNDLADISQCSKTGILLNDGHGGFEFNGTYGTGHASRAVSLGDFNHDGFKDVAYVNNGVGWDGNVTVVLNNRNGTFSSPLWLYAGDLPDDLTVGDFDGDGNTDIAIANSYFSQIFILLNSRDASFPGYIEIPVGGAPTSVTSADFNGDGLTDVAFTSWSTGRLTVYLNQGRYNFFGPSFSVGQSPVDVVAGNLDDDSLPDLVSVNQGSGSITILLSSGGASTPPPAPPPTPQITLSASTRTTWSAKLVDLRWGGATGSNIDIYRNGSRIAVVSNTGSYTDRLGRRTTGTFRYKACLAGSQTCSGESTVRF